MGWEQDVCAVTSVETPYPGSTIVFQHFNLPGPGLWCLNALSHSVLNVEFQEELCASRVTENVLRKVSQTVRLRFIKRQHHRPSLDVCTPSSF